MGRRTSTISLTEDAPVSLFIKSPEAEHVCEMTTNKKNYALCNSLQWSTSQSKPEQTKGRSLTVPEKSLTIKQIIENALRGQDPVGAMGSPVYNGDILIPDIKTLDFTDVENLKRQLEAERFHLANEVKALHMKDGKSEILEQINTSLNELQAQKKSLNSPKGEAEKN